MLSRVNAFIDNGWDKIRVDPDSNKKYNKLIKLQSPLIPHTPDLQSATQSSVNDHSCSRPKGLYTQQILRVLPLILTDEIIFSHLQAYGKQFRPKKNANRQPANINSSTLQRGHQYFMRGYIPGKHVMFCLLCA